MIVIPVVCLIIALIMCSAYGTPLFKDNLSISTYFYGLAYLSLVAFAVSINLHSGRFDFSISTIIILSSTVVIMLACSGVNNMLVLLLAGLGVGLLGGLISGILYLTLRLPPMILSLGVALLYEALSYMIAGGSESNNVGNLQLDIANSMKAFIGANNSSPIFLLMILGAALLFMIVVFHYTKFGYDYRALQSGQKIAVNTGANESRNALLCYAIAGSLAGLAGFLYGCNVQYTRVSAFLNFGTVSRMVMLAGWTTIAEHIDLIYTEK